MGKNVWSEDAENTLNSIESNLIEVADETRRTANLLQSILQVLTTSPSKQKENVSDETPNQNTDTTGAVICDMIELINKIKRLRAADDSATNIARNYAVTITMLEQATAYFSTYVHQNP